MALRTRGLEEPGTVVSRNGRGAGSTRRDACRSVAGEGARVPVTEEARSQLRLENCEKTLGVRSEEKARWGAGCGPSGQLRPHWDQQSHVSDGRRGEAAWLLGMGRYEFSLDILTLRG